MRFKKNLVTVALAILLFSCKKSDTLETAEAIYFGGDIITMDGETPQYAEAVAIKDGKILFVGSKAEAEKLKGDATIMNDLKGKTLVPGFIDPHAHFTGFSAQAVIANLLAAPDGNCNSMDDLINELKNWHAKNGIDKTQGWILGIGFDDAVLKENRFPTKEDLDKVSTTIPVCIVHISGHFAVMNTKGLEMSKITAATVDPPGGTIRRIAGSKAPNGVLEENAAFPYFLPIFNPKEPAMVDYYYDKGQDLAASFGCTTVTEGMATDNHLKMADYATRGKLKMDLIS